ncbi:MAG: hypothetical protein HGA27_01710 [Peptococcaceae bacterium]|nr:hypothetical protein [Peptococcaceae bacterium]
MILGIMLIAAAIIGTIYGIVNKNKKMLAASLTLLIIIAAIWLAYSYQYAKNPY